MNIPVFQVLSCTVSCFTHLYFPVHISLFLFCVLATERRTAISFMLQPKWRCSHFKMFMSSVGLRWVSFHMCWPTFSWLYVHTQDTMGGSLTVRIQTAGFCTGVLLLKHLLNGTGTYVLPNWQRVQFQTQPEEFSWVCDWLREKETWKTCGTGKKESGQTHNSVFRKMHLLRLLRIIWEREVVHWRIWPHQQNVCNMIQGRCR